MRVSGSDLKWVRYACIPPVNMQGVANHYRQMFRPKDLRDLFFDLIERHIFQNFLIGDIEGIVRGAHLLFAIDKQLAILKKAKRWYMAATFTVVKSPYHQVLSIYAFITRGSSSKQLPLTFCLTSSRSKHDCQAVLKQLLQVVDCQVNAIYRKLQE